MILIADFQVVSVYQRITLRWLHPAIALFVVLPFARPDRPNPVSREVPRLVVLVVFDQMRGDYLTRWDKLFVDGGFRELERNGARFQNCHYPYASTATGPGHTSIVTGANPRRHGIISNDWYDRSTGQTVYCVASDRYSQIPSLREGGQTKAGKRKKNDGGIGPERILLESFGDALKRATGGSGKVVSLSLKDRASACMGGRHPDACYWFCTDTGEFVTSTYYRNALHPWVSMINAQRLADRWYGQKWNRLHLDLDYKLYSGLDDVAGEGTGVSQGRTFPHLINGGEKQRGGKYYEALYNSPFANELLLELTRRAIQAEQLGTRGVPDFLCISFSANDPIGHTWGPDSQEVMDVTLRSDLLVKELIAYLDAKVGKGRYTLALTADHGVCPLPELSSAQGKEALRIPAERILSQADAFLTKTFGVNGTDKPHWIEWPKDSWIYLNQDLLRERGLEPAHVETVLARWLKEQPGIWTAFTRNQLANEPAANDEIGRRVWNSYYSERSGDVVAVPKPYTLLTSRLTGTTHGTGHDYDTHVPLLIYGPGVCKGIRLKPVTPLAIPRIFARALGISS